MSRLTLMALATLGLAACAQSPGTPPPATNTGLTIGNCAGAALSYSDQLAERHPLGLRDPRIQYIADR